MASPPDIEEFLRWAAGLGITDSPPALKEDHNMQSCLGHSLFVSNFQNAGGRGLAAARHLRKGELILRVPKNALMSRESLMKDEEFAKSLRRHPNLSSTQVEDAIWAAERVIAKAQQEWGEAQLLMHEIGLKHRFRSLKSWLWAFATVASRTLHVPWDSAGCLCPVGDLFNYVAPGVNLEVEMEACSSESSLGKSYQGKNCSSIDIIRCCEVQSTVEGKLILNQENTEEVSNNNECNGFNESLTDGGYEEEVGAYCFYARERYRQGEQVLLCYGVYTNLELLEHYGFILNDNPNDKLFINLDVDMLTLKHWQRNHLYLQWDGKPSFSLLAALRFHGTPSSLRKTIGHLAFSGLQISVENDIAVSKWLVQRCEGLIAKLPTTRAEDELLLEIIDRCLGAEGIEFIMDTLHDIELDPYCYSCVLLDPFPKWTSLSSKRRHIVISELSAFFNMHSLQRHNDIALLFEKEVSHSLSRWKLAIQSRLGYKTTLHHCISFCNGQLEHLCQGQAGKRDKSKDTKCHIKL